MAVSTHSRAKAAATPNADPKRLSKFQHTAARRRLRRCKSSGRPETRFQHTAARRRLHLTSVRPIAIPKVSTHSRSKAAAGRVLPGLASRRVSTHSRSKAAAPGVLTTTFTVAWFQHTAARRRLRAKNLYNPFRKNVSTHSRSKAAARENSSLRFNMGSFNTQPLEGGCGALANPHRHTETFQHTAARRRLQVEYE